MNAGAVKLQSKRQARQYMNRKVRVMCGGLLWHRLACIQLLLSASST